MKKGKVQEFETALHRLRGKNADISQETNDIKVTLPLFMSCLTILYVNHFPFWQRIYEIGFLHRIMQNTVDGCPVREFEVCFSANMLIASL